ncbi:MAG: exodeoxyribonuclease VII small subunit [Ruminococcus sp.]|jgi:exodeoxyribonuclease VII small subunit|nr:exodeoxyribonuclease VII small subunit [Ruminococcus sp.]
MDLEKSFSRLEEIIEQMNSAKIDEALAMYKEGLEIIGGAKTALDKARADFEKAKAETL